MTKKKVTAPLTYDPGKGRPKEHLAYLNWHEMQALKRLNGNNQERGPMGLPSFPPADAIGSSSKASSSKSTGARGPTGPKGEARASPASGGKAGSVSRSAGTSKSSSDRQGGGSGVKGSKGGGASTQRAGAGKGMAKAGEVSKARNEAQKGNLAADRARASRESGVKSLSVGPMGTRVDVTKKAPGSQIKGAIKGVQETARTTPAATQALRAGPFGAPAYTGRYNPATNRFDAAPTQTVNRVGKVDYGPVMPSGTSGMWGGPPQTVNRIAKTSFQGVRPSGTMTQFGGPTVDVVNRAGKVDMPAPARSISDTLSDYATSIGDTIYGGIRSIGSMLPDSPVQVSPADVRRAIESMRYQAPQADFMEGMAPYTTGDIAMRNAISGTPGGVDYGGMMEGALAGQGLSSALEAQKVGASAPKAKIADRVPASVQPTPSPFSWEGVRPYDVRITAPPASGIDLRAPVTREVKIEPMGMGAPPFARYASEGLPPGYADRYLNEKVVSVENVPEESGVVGYKRVPTEENLMPYQARTYDTPYPVDENGVPIQDVSAADLAKIRARRRGEEYAPTPEERRAITAGKVVSKVITKDIPGLGKVFNVEGNMRDYYSRPSWEQGYIKERAKASGALSDIGSTRSSNERPVFGGIGSLATTTPAPTASTTGTSMTGTRPTEYYYWDLGLNIPSPTDKNYTNYQNYLRERAAAQAAMFG